MYETILAILCSPQPVACSHRLAKLALWRSKVALVLPTMYGVGWDTLICNYTPIFFYSTSAVTMAHKYNVCKIGTEIELCSALNLH